MIRVRLDAMTMSDGTQVQVPAGGIVVFVGPNNAGKSRALRDIDALMSNPNAGNDVVVVKTIEWSKEGSLEDLQTWLGENAEERSRAGVPHYSRVTGGELQWRTIEDRWERQANLMELWRFFSFYGTAESRLGSSQPAQLVDFLNQAPAHPLHHLYLDESLEEKVRNISKQAFGVGVLVNRYAGQNVHMQMGEPPNPPHGAAPSMEYIRTIGAMPQLHQQGDGMRSFIGIVLNIAVATHFALLIDEPEAFLHPPQAHLLGRVLGELKGPQTQVLLATHDTNIVRGVLDSPAKDVTIVRLVRDGDINRTSQLAPKNVSHLWEDPLLRYSNILDGLFHQAVVLCEADADCRFYASALDVVVEEEGQPRRPELLWTHCGGKHRMPVVVRALRGVKVPVRVIADFDVLREEQPLRGIVEGLDGTWNDVSDDWHQLKAALDDLTRGPDINYVRQEIERLLDGVGGPRLGSSEVDAIRALTRSDSGWDAVKLTGKAGVPQGDATKSLDRLLSRLRDIGLFVVEKGELERFVPSVAGKGTRWVAEVHENGLHASDEAADARAFVRAVAESALGEWAVPGNKVAASS